MLLKIAYQKWIFLFQRPLNTYALFMFNRFEAGLVQGRKCLGVSVHGQKCLGAYCLLWQYGLWSFQTGGTNLERFLPKNQHTQRKLFNFENWISGGLRSFQKSEF